jgi:hypothetical protein
MACFPFVLLDSRVESIYYFTCATHFDLTECGLYRMGRLTCLNRRLALTSDLCGLLARTVSLCESPCVVLPFVS